MNKMLPMMVLLLASQAWAQAPAATTPPVQDVKYRKVNALGEQVVETEKAWECVDDTTTGLMWEAKQKSGLHGFDAKFTWFKAFDKLDPASFVNQVNKAGLCGFNDWRGPTKQELLGLISDANTPMIDPKFFLFTGAGGYWATDVYADDPTHAWNVFFDFGFEGEDEKVNAYYVRLVRNGNGKPLPVVEKAPEPVVPAEPLPLPDVPENMDTFKKMSKDGKVLPDDAKEWACVVQDKKEPKEDLIWEVKQVSGLHNGQDKYVWKDAFDVWEEGSFVNKVNEEELCGYDEWRGPTKDELKELLDGGQLPLVKPEFFPNMLAAGYWTSQDYDYGDTHAYNVHFDEGVDLSGNKEYEYYVILVHTKPY